jgi:hypothetical protein
VSVSLLVSGVVAAAAAVMFNAGLKSNTTSEARVDTINAARVSVESMSRTLRTAVLPRQLDDAGSTDAAFLSASASEVRFYANINNPDNVIGPSRVTYRVSGRDLVQTIQPPDAHAPDDHDYRYCDPGAPGCVSRSMVLASGLETSVPVFTYYDDAGAALTLSGSCAGVACLPGNSLDVIDAVEVRVVVAPPARAPGIGPTTYVLRVALPNNDAIIREDGK